MTGPANPNTRIIQLYLLIQHTTKSTYDGLFLKCWRLHSDLTNLLISQDSIWWDSLHLFCLTYNSFKYMDCHRLQSTLLHCHSSPNTYSFIPLHPNALSSSLNGRAFRLSPLNTCSTVALDDVAGEMEGWWSSGSLHLQTLNPQHTRENCTD